MTRRVLQVLSGRVSIENGKRTYTYKHTRTHTATHIVMYAHAHTVTHYVRAETDMKPVAAGWQPWRQRLIKIDEATYGRF